MRILVTGGAGYIGSHVVRSLAGHGFDVIVYDNLSRGHRESVAQFPLVCGDIANRALLAETIEVWGVGAVVHLAADSVVGESVADPRRYFNNNVAQGLALLDTMLDSGVRYFIFSSTAAVYGEPETLPIPEDHPFRPTNPYGESKAFIETVLRRYDQAYGLRYASLRYFNAAGAHPDGDIGEDHEPETHLIPLILQVAQGVRDVVTVFGDDYPTPDGTAVRDYIHVCDLAEAHVLALHALLEGGVSCVYNLGNSRGYSVLEVIETARRVTGCTIPYTVGPRRQGDPAVLIASSDRARRHLGWSPRYSGLEAIIRTAWEWHRAHPRGYGTGAPMGAESR